MSFIWNFGPCRGHRRRTVGRGLLVSGVTVRAGRALIGDGSNDRLWVFLGSAAVILLLNMTVRPVLHILGLPLSILTLGLFALVINALVFLLAGTLSQAIGLGLMVDSFMAAFWGAIIMAVVNWILGPITGLLSAR